MGVIQPATFLVVQPCLKSDGSTSLVYMPMATAWTPWLLLFKASLVSWDTGENGAKTKMS